MSTFAIALGALGMLVGLALGYYLRLIVSLGKKGSMELEIKKMMISAKEEARKILDDAKKKEEEKIEELKGLEKEKELEFKKTEERFIKKEEFLDQRQKDLDEESEQIKQKSEEIENKKKEVEEIENKKKTELEKISGLTKEDAENKILEEIRKNNEEDILVKLQKLERDGEEKLEKKAREILTTTIQRLASATNSEMMTTSVTIPSDEIKGKIIGKEGRNIRAFEKSAGVELIVDDTPGTIVISSFDPVRRQIARVALENLILDGRIQPAKIEEEIEKAKNDINKIIKQKGEEAVYECGILNFDPRLVAVLGRLYFRTSYGQNVLQHSVEMSHIAGMIAEELGLDPYVAKAGALVHDIGKALDHEVQGTHVEIGIRILEKFGADPRIVIAMRSHHDEYPYESLEARIVQTADAISGGRPGARRDSVEQYLKRLEDIENIANSFSGVEKTYALSAGREVRVFVTPGEVTDLDAKEMARDIALKIEQELRYPGEIKVMVIRETRVIEFAR
ncbi:ribonuclease Y, partial [Candidatus Nomurabacteria bacterium]|nr:ribonuclease Y [Candidatus Nomurabacteria bacterium]